MKKMLGALLVSGVLLAALTTVWAKSEWAIYKENPVPDDVNVPVKFIDPETRTLDCCACHWNTNHDGPQFCD